MSRPIALRRVARSEYDEAVEWYEGQQAGSGLALAAAIERVFARISALPKLHPIVRRDVRRAVVKKFPYCVYYREQPKSIVVVAVFHTSRNPSDWHSRK